MLSDAELPVATLKGCKHGASKRDISHLSRRTHVAQLLSSSGTGSSPCRRSIRTTRSCLYKTSSGSCCFSSSNTGTATAGWTSTMKSKRAVKPWSSMPPPAAAAPAPETPLEVSAAAGAAASPPPAPPATAMPAANGGDDGLRRRRCAAAVMRIKLGKRGYSSSSSSNSAGIATRLGEREKESAGKPKTNRLPRVRKGPAIAPCLLACLKQYPCVFPVYSWDSSRQ